VHNGGLGIASGFEVLVGAGGVLAGPLVQLLALVAAGAVDVQTQSAVLVLELPRAVGLLLRQPLAGRVAVDRLLHDVGHTLRGRAAGHRDILAGVLDLQLAVSTGGGYELELLVGPAVAGPLIDDGPGGGAGAVVVEAQAVVGDDEGPVAGRISARAAGATRVTACDYGGAGDVDGVDLQVGAAGLDDFEGVCAVGQPADVVERLLGLSG